MIPTKATVFATAGVAKAQELGYELKVSDVMTHNVITIEPSATMFEAKDLMRDNRVSGLPVMVDGKLVAMISMEDLIFAMEGCSLDSPVAEYMSPGVYTIHEDESVVQALTRFAQIKVGRLPVVNRDGELIGILTPGDITRGLFKALHEAFHAEELRRYRASHLFEDIASDRTSVRLSYDVSVRDFSRAGRASSQLKLALGRLGIDPRIVRRVAVAAYEAEMNMVIHTLEGGVLEAEVTAERITIFAKDRGPGIADVEKALQPGFSTAPDWIRELGFGAGMGLVNIRNSMDEFSLETSVPEGTVLAATVHLHPQEGRESDEAARRN